MFERWENFVLPKRDTEYPSFRRGSVIAVYGTDHLTRIKRSFLISRRRVTYHRNRVQGKPRHPNRVMKYCEV